MSEPNCMNCPSMLTTDETVQQGWFNKNVGAPMCARFGKPIGSANSSEQQRRDVGKAIAKTCPKFGEPRPQQVAWHEADFTVAFPDPEVLKFNRHMSPETVRRCNMCEHFVREDVVLADMGWSTGLCAAKGKMLLPSRYEFEARHCTEKSAALSGIRTNTNNIMMLPEYSADFTLSTDPVKYHEQQKALNIPDPEDYPTDRIVTQEEKDNGIRAWRLVEDPETKNSTHLPIYRRDFFNAEEQKKIPATGDDEHPEDYIDHGFYTYKVSVLWCQLDETPGFSGQAGTGKTEFFRYMAWLMQLPFERISVTGSTELDELEGTTHYDPEKGTYWKDGRIPTAWSKPCVMVVDEPNVGKPDVWQFLRPMFDNSKQLVVNDVMRSRHEDCYIGLAMNPAWDPKNVGTHQVSDADVNRLMHIFMPMPPESLEREIIKKRCGHDGYDIEPDTLNTIMQIAVEIRALCDDDTIPATWGVRPQLKVARASKWFDLRTCYRMAIADFLEPEQMQAVLDCVEANVT